MVIQAVGSKKHRIARFSILLSALRYRFFHRPHPAWGQGLADTYRDRGMLARPGGIGIIVARVGLSVVPRESARGQLSGGWGPAHHYA